VKITAITCTFERPAALELCRKYMARQTRQPDQWIILDGPEPMIEKLLNAFEAGKIEGEKIVFMEDDDFYRSDWVEWCERMLEKYELVGEGMAIYYNVRKRWWSQCNNHTHASLCQTAIRRSMFETLCNIIRAHNCPWIDTQLWKIECDKMLSCSHRRVIGIKGMPGKAGYSREHHKFDPQGCVRDPSLKKLFELIGPDASAYLPFYDHGRTT
jgi:hypothetical protein